MVRKGDNKFFLEIKVSHSRQLQRGRQFRKLVKYAATRRHLYALFDKEWIRTKTVFVIVYVDGGKVCINGSIAN